MVLALVVTGEMLVLLFALQNSISALQNGYKSYPGGKWLSRIHSQRLKTRRVCNGACFGLKRLRAALRALYRHE